MKGFKLHICATVFLVAAPLTAKSQSSSEMSILPGEKFPETHSRYLTEAEISGWTLEKVRYAINEMFARHGAFFEKPDLKNTFTRFPWYKPRKELNLDQIEQGFSDVEKENLKLLAYFRDAKSQTNGRSPSSRFESRQQPALIQPLKRVSTESVAVPITPGSERIPIKGLRLGAGPSALSVFLKESSLQQIESPNTSQVKGKHSPQEVSYISQQKYSNGKTGLGEISVDVEFTAPIPTSEGVVSLVWRIDYTTYYGEGLTGEQVISELEKKYGRAGEKWNAKGAIWRIDGPRADCALQADITPPGRAGAFGKLSLRANDSLLLWKSLDIAQAHIDQADARRPKDATKPDF